MSKRTIAALALAALLALPGTATAKYIREGGGGSGNNPRELSANEQIMADAGKSALHSQKAEAFEGLG
ncbi:MAG TPA: hypothetical protein VFV13_11210 [Acidimicrobiia bacterium]|nr:hypothetical protein [Acidimicrobiia bacterium]